MNLKQIINERQFAWITATIVTNCGLPTLQNALIRLSEMDAWFSYVLSVFYFFVIAGFFAYMAKAFPKKNIFEISILLLGKWGGAAVNLLIMFHIWQSLLRDLGFSGRYSSTLLLHNTPLEILILLPCLLLIYFGKTSLEVIARVNDLFYPLFTATVLLMPLLLANELDLRLVSPTLTTSFSHLFYGNMLSVGGMGDIFFMGAFLHTLSNSNHIRSSIRYGSLLAISLLTLIIFIILIVLGPKMPGNFLYPTYNLVQMINITDFLDRMDIIILTIFLPAFACKMVAIYLALLLGVSSLIREPDYPIMNKQIGLFIVLTTILSYKSTTEVLSFSNFSSIVIVLAYQPAVMIILLVAAFKHQRKITGQEQHSLNSPSGAPDKPMGKMSMNFSYKRLIWLGNGLILCAVCCIGVGLIFSKYIPAVGRFCGLCFACCLLLALMTTYLEISRLKQTQPGG